jgi:serine/threonine protein kinase
MIGTRLGHYEITAHIGAGGMGEVYQATDSKLGRSVAIKLLPEAFARDTDRLARFEREARVLASLNHPHIAAIHGFEETGGRNFLVMELVPGATLAERIGGRSLPVPEALSIAKQIAEALDAAHEKGIVHRDLKPANIKITPDGQVKVLDFGLAKAFADEAAESNLSNSPTLSRAATNAGVILGTAAYMSPEQAKGLAVDKRTDIFAFGSVMYEMLTGGPPFPGETVTEILARVIEREPDWTKLPADLHPRIAQLLRRCLEKNPKKRRRDIGDVRMEIEEALTDPVSRLSETAAPAGRSSWLPWIVAVIVSFASVAAIAALYFRPAGEAPEMRVDIVTPPSPDATSFAISPDGRRMVFLASPTSNDSAPQLWLRRLDGATAQPLAGTEGAAYPFWSADSGSIGFFASGKLKRIDIGGGLPQILADTGSGRGAAWSADGVILFAPTTGSPLMRIPATGGTPVAVTKLDGTKQTSHRFPQFLPDSRKFLFYAQGTEDSAGVYLGSLDTGEAQRLTPSDTAGFYVPPGWLLYVQQGALVARRFDASRGELSGEPVTVADAVAVDGINIAALSVSVTGLITYRSGRAGRRQLTWLDRSGKILGTLGSSDEAGLSGPELSPDGRRVAVDRTVQGNTDIWIIDAARTTRLTFDAAVDHWPIWSSDGRHIIFDSARGAGGIHNIYQKASDGAGNDELLFEDMYGKGVLDSSMDGRFVIFIADGALTARDVWLLPRDGDRTARTFLNGNFMESGAQFSPNGRWVAYQSNESGRFEIYVRPFPGPGGQWQVSASGGTGVRWRRDGKELYYLSLENRLMAAPITTRGSTLESGTPVSLFQMRVAGGAAGTISLRPQYDVAVDGRFLVNMMVEDSALSPITLLLNWHPPAK